MTMLQSQCNVVSTLDMPEFMLFQALPGLFLLKTLERLGHDLDLFII